MNTKEILRRAKVFGVQGDDEAIIAFAKNLFDIARLRSIYILEEEAIEFSMPLIKDALTMCAERIDNEIRA